MARPFSKYPKHHQLLVRLNDEQFKLFKKAFNLYVVKLPKEKDELTMTEFIRQQIMENVSWINAQEIKVDKSPWGLLRKKADITGLSVLKDINNDPPTYHIYTREWEYVHQGISGYVAVNEIFSGTIKQCDDFLNNFDKSKGYFYKEDK